nr:DoxX family protein [Aquisediminimonas sediminicola]
MTHLWRQVLCVLSGKMVEGGVMLLVRLALAGVFWRSGRAKIEEGSWLTISENTRFLFAEEYSGIPLPTAFATLAATTAEHLFPILLVLGLATRLSALGLLGMTLMIQIFVYPDAWWPVHSLWAALALTLVVRGGGLFSADALIARKWLA